MAENTDEQEQNVGKPVSEKDEELLKEIRDDYTFCKNYWEFNRQEATKDMNYVAGNGWTADDLTQRANRPCLWPDEISQYVKQVCNNLRQNKRAIKVNPKGDGATDEDADRRAAIIRAIEYQSDAQAAYTTAFEQAVESGMGFFRINREYIRAGKPEVQPRISRIPNQFTVFPDPNAKLADFSDSELYFVLDNMRKSTFAKKYPKANKRSFTAEDAKTAPDWFHGEDIIVAERWTIEDEKVIQRITNGVEILETNVWAETPKFSHLWIPIIGVFGEEIYTNEGGQSKRVFLSLVRRARDPQHMLAYIASQQAEEFQLTPRVPFLIWEGQELADQAAWADMTNVPHPYIRIKPVVEGQSNQLLPPPSRQPFQPNAEAYEVARESWRRAIQAAMGITPLPTNAQKVNDKSGIALDKIQTSEATGSYHFTDNFYRALENAGRQLNQEITVTMDTPRQVGMRHDDQSHELLWVTTQEHGKPEGAESDDYLVTDRGEFDVTISEGTSYQSEREANADFIDTIIPELAQLAQTLPPGTIPKFLAKAIKLRGLGPEGDEMAEILEPPDPNAPNPQALQQQVSILTAQLQEAGVLVQKYEGERQGKVIETQAKIAIEQMKDYSDKQKFAIEQEVKLAVAEITAKTQTMGDRESLISDVLKQLHGQAHELGMQKDQQAHDKQMGAQQAQQQAILAAQGQQGQAQLAAQGHEQNLEAQAGQPA